MDTSPLQLVAGLGNPGLKYDLTRHNVGFMALDLLAGQQGLTWRNRGKGLEAVWHCHGSRVVLLKPQTFMNLSGFAVSDALSYYKLDTHQYVVLTDEVHLPLGTLRLRPKGSAGGHNGLKNIIAQTGTQEFWRLRMGVGGRRHPGQDLTSHVLGRFSPDEQPALDDLLQRTVDCVHTMIEQTPELAMSRFNGGPDGAESAPPEGAP